MSSSIGRQPFKIALVDAFGNALGNRGFRLLDGTTEVEAYAGGEPGDLRLAYPQVTNAKGESTIWLPSTTPSCVFSLEVYDKNNCLLPGTNEIVFVSAVSVQGVVYDDSTVVADIAANTVRIEALEATPFGVDQTARDAAEDARLEADQASQEAADASGEADAAQVSATQANTAARRAEGKADNAVVRATSAEVTANTASGRVVGAIQDAASARTIANRAEGKADAAEVAVGRAQNVATIASNVASTARTIAQRAEGKADSAQSDIDALPPQLTIRVQGGTLQASTDGGATYNDISPLGGQATPQLALRLQGNIIQFSRDDGTTFTDLATVALQSDLDDYVETADLLPQTLIRIDGSRLEYSLDGGDTYVDAGEIGTSDAGDGGIDLIARDAAAAAQTTANAASTTATRAEGKADAAQTTADRAEGSIDIVNTVANRAEGKADGAQTTADRAEGKADTAQTTADRAEGKADSAQSTADGAVSDAANAHSAANTGIRDAGTAQTTADRAEGKADAAQMDATTNASAIDDLSPQLRVRIASERLEASVDGGVNYTVIGAVGSSGVVNYDDVAVRGLITGNTNRIMALEDGEVIDTTARSDAAAAQRTAESASTQAEQAAIAAGSAQTTANRAEGKADAAQMDATTNASAIDDLSPQLRVRIASERLEASVDGGVNYTVIGAVGSSGVVNYDDVAVRGLITGNTNRIMALEDGEVIDTTARSDAAAAQRTAESASTQAEQAAIAAGSAQTTANRAEGKADAAQVDATANATNIGRAQTTADRAEGKADSAQSTANTAETNAGAAQSTADRAVTDAAAAQADIDALPPQYIVRLAGSNLEASTDGGANYTVIGTIASDGEVVMYDDTAVRGLITGNTNRIATLETREVIDTTARSSASMGRNVAANAQNIANRAEGKADAAQTDIDALPPQLRVRIISERLEASIDGGTNYTTIGEVGAGGVVAYDDTAVRGLITGNTNRITALEDGEVIDTTARSSASMGRSVAANAQNIANRAEGKADTAQTTADRAEGKADTAQADIDALPPQVQIRIRGTMLEISTDGGTTYTLAGTLPSGGDGADLSSLQFRMEGNDIQVSYDSGMNYSTIATLPDITSLEEFDALVGEREAREIWVPDTTVGLKVFLEFFPNGEGLATHSSIGSGRDLIVDGNGAQLGIGSEVTLTQRFQGGWAIRINNAQADTPEEILPPGRSVVVYNTSTGEIIDRWVTADVGARQTNLGAGWSLVTRLGGFAIFDYPPLTGFRVEQLESADEGVFSANTFKVQTGSYLRDTIPQSALSVGAQRALSSLSGEQRQKLASIMLRRELYGQPRDATIADGIRWGAPTSLASLEDLDRTSLIADVGETGRFIFAVPNSHNIVISGFVDGSTGVLLENSYQVIGGYVLWEVDKLTSEDTPSGIQVQEFRYNGVEPTPTEQILRTDLDAAQVDIMTARQAAATNRADLATLIRLSRLDKDILQELEALVVERTTDELTIDGYEADYLGATPYDVNVAKSLAKDPEPVVTEVRDADAGIPGHTMNQVDLDWSRDVSERVMLMDANLYGGYYNSVQTLMRIPNTASPGSPFKLLLDQANDQILVQTHAGGFRETALQAGVKDRVNRFALGFSKDASTDNLVFNFASNGFAAAGGANIQIGIGYDDLDWSAVAIGHDGLDLTARIFEADSGNTEVNISTRIPPNTATPPIRVERILIEKGDLERSEGIENNSDYDHIGFNRSPWTTIPHTQGTARTYPLTAFGENSYTLSHQIGRFAHTGDNDNWLVIFGHEIQAVYFTSQAYNLDRSYYYTPRLLLRGNVLQSGAWTDNGDGTYSPRFGNGHVDWGWQGSSNLGFDQVESITVFTNGGITYSRLDWARDTDHNIFNGISLFHDAERNPPVPDLEIDIQSYDSREGNSTRLPGDVTQLLLLDGAVADPSPGDLATLTERSLSEYVRTTTNSVLDLSSLAGEADPTKHNVLFDDSPVIASSPIFNTLTRTGGYDGAIVAAPPFISEGDLTGLDNTASAVDQHRLFRGMALPIQDIAGTNSDYELVNIERPYGYKSNSSGGSSSSQISFTVTDRFQAGMRMKKDAQVRLHGRLVIGEFVGNNMLTGDTTSVSNLACTIYRRRGRTDTPIEEAKTTFRNLSDFALLEISTYGGDWIEVEEGDILWVLIYHARSGGSGFWRLKPGDDGVLANVAPNGMSLYVRSIQAAPPPIGGGGSDVLTFDRFELEYNNDQHTSAASGQSKSGGYGSLQFHNAFVGNIPIGGSSVKDIAIPFREFSDASGTIEIENIEISTPTAGQPNVGNWLGGVKFLKDGYARINSNLIFSSNINANEDYSVAVSTALVQRRGSTDTTIDVTSEETAVRPIAKAIDLKTQWVRVNKDDVFWMRLFASSADVSASSFSPNAEVSENMIEFFGNNGLVVDFRDVAPEIDEEGLEARVTGNTNRIITLEEAPAGGGSNVDVFEHFVLPYNDAPWGGSASSALTGGYGDRAGTGNGALVIQPPGGNQVFNTNRTISELSIPLNPYAGSDTSISTVEIPSNGTVRGASDIPWASRWLAGVRFNKNGAFRATANFIAPFAFNSRAEIIYYYITIVHTRGGSDSVIGLNTITLLPTSIGYVRTVPTNVSVPWTPVMQGDTIWTRFFLEAGPSNNLSFSTGSVLIDARFPPNALTVDFRE